MYHHLPSFQEASFNQLSAIISYWW